jgi:hypothetical protein
LPKASSWGGTSGDSNPFMEQNTHPPVLPKKSRTWWQRNWKWFVPVAGLGSLVLFAAFIALIVTIVLGRIQSSDVYKDALATARTNPSVIKALGSPIQADRFVTGSIIKRGPFGEADLAIAISGPKGKGTIYARASKSMGRWTFSQLAVEIKATKEVIELIKARAQEKAPRRSYNGRTEI